MSFHFPRTVCSSKWTPGELQLIISKLEALAWLSYACIFRKLLTYYWAYFCFVLSQFTHEHDLDLWDSSVSFISTAGSKICFLVLFIQIFVYQMYLPSGLSFACPVGRRRFWFNMLRFLSQISFVWRFKLQKADSDLFVTAWQTGLNILITNLFLRHPLSPNPMNLLNPNSSIRQSRDLILHLWWYLRMWDWQDRLC